MSTREQKGSKKAIYFFFLLIVEQEESFARVGYIFKKKFNFKNLTVIFKIILIKFKVNKNLTFIKSIPCLYLN